MLADNKLLDSVPGAEFDDELDDFGGVEATVPSDDEGGPGAGNGAEDRLDEVLGVVG